MNCTDPMKQTVGQKLLLKRPKKAYEVKLAQHLASHESKGLAIQRAKLLSFA